MSTERWERTKQILEEALRLGSEQRRSYLEIACGTDSELRAEVESLIASHEAAGSQFLAAAERGLSSFMEQPAVQSAALKSGTKLGPYEILALLGIGGMGEVYEAHDTKLGRNVAIKVLPAAFVHDPERLARFQREARMLAALNHPNIATIYGLEQSERVHYLVMELVPGETLAELIRKGALPLGEVLRVASQIAEALEAAHEKGVIHRDLKPANVKMTPGGRVKVLDFGLAKAFAADGGQVLSHTPTLTAVGTEEVKILGTPAYMSPEQARGKPVDKRTDIWAFGCVLYELLTARPAIRGETLSDTIAAVLEREPDWQALPASTPTKIRDLLRRCLRKERDRRLRDIGDARVEIEEALAAPKDAAPSPAITVTASATRSRAPLLVWIAAGALLVGLGILAFVHFRGTPPVAQPVRLQIPVPDGMTIYNFQVAISPDGRRVAFSAGGTDTPRRLWIRELDSLELRTMPGAEISARPGPPPFWSPDGRWVAFVAGDKLKKVEISGGFPQTICDAEILGGAWNRDGVIILGGEGGLRRCPAAGGPTAPVTVLARDETAHARPQFLPDGRHFLYSRITHTPEKTGVFVGSLDAKAAEQDMKPLLVTAEQASYAPSETGGAGWLFFTREATLMAQPFDPGKLALSGEPVPIAGPIGSFPFLRVAFFAVSNTGVVIYRGPGIAQSQLTWFDAHGRTSAFGEPDDYNMPAVSPDGTRIAAVLTDTQGNEDVWVLDAAHGTRKRLTFDPAADEEPVWSRDGKKIAFISNRGGRWDLYVKASDGSGNDQLLLKTDEDKEPASWSGDGRYLLYTTDDPKNDLWVLPLDGPEGAPDKPFPLQQTDSHERFFQFSPGPGTPRWIAYMSDETGAFEVYVRPFSPDSRGGSSASGEKAMVSSGGGLFPQWRADGKQLFYRSPTGTLMAVVVTSEKPFQTGVPRRLFDPGPLEGSNKWSVFGITADGRRFLFNLPSGGRTPLTVLLNWQAGLKK